MKQVLFILFSLVAWSSSLAQNLATDYTTAEISDIQTNQTSNEGDLYHDYQQDIWYLGLTGGTLKQISDKQVLTFNTNSNELTISNGNTVTVQPRTIPIVEVKTGSYTLQAADIGKVITINNPNSTILTIPTGLPIGFNISLYQIGTGQITIQGQGGVQIKHRLSRFKTAGQDSGVGIMCTANNTFHLTGDLSN
jgi:hypothetical protein